MSRHNTIKDFWDKVEKTNTCWIRHGCRIGHGYNVLGWNGIQKYAHRLSWELHFGPIPKGMAILHKCDNPPCVNPEHLFIGTLADNVHDMVQKQRRGYTGLPGEKHPSHKLTQDLVLLIRKLYHQGNITQQELANRYNVTQRTISKAISGFTWKNI